MPCCRHPGSLELPGETGTLTRVLHLLLLLTLALGAAPARALSEAIEIRITSVLQDSLGLGVNVGDVAQARIGHGDCADPGCRDYYSPGGDFYDFLVGLDLSLGGFEIGTSSSLSDWVSSGVTIRNGSGAAGYDRYSAHATQGFDLGPLPAGPPGLPFLDSIFGSFSVVLTDDDGTAFDSAWIPSSLPLAQFESGSFGLYLEVTWSNAAITQVESRYLQLVGEIILPEPSTGVLAGLGLAGLAAWRRARRSRRAPSRSVTRRGPG